ncbi:MAG: prepilin-type N-terminal cleavage/methylation domain-containing protein [Clostridia bacterium]|nr:prepilin-type N-terminal cleavage/methylation domain-containing protein [Clostridia bacterium]
MRSWISFLSHWAVDQDGFSLVEVLVCLFILSLVAGPLISLLLSALQEYMVAWERTEAVYTAQSFLEPLLNQTLLSPNGTEGFCPHPSLPNYEYRITITPYMGPGLDQITVELKEKDRQETMLVLTTLKARRKLYVPIPE